MSTTSQPESYRSFRITFKPTPSSRRRSWERFYVPEVGSDAVNRAWAEDVIKSEYPRAVIVGCEDLPPRKACPCHPNAVPWGF